MNGITVLLLRVITFAIFLSPLMAEAVPSFARQTQMDCAACHTVFPQLTPYGRQFKLSGYTLVSPFGDQSQMSGRLPADPPAPLSAMLLVSYSAMQSSDSGVNGHKARATVDFPQTFSLFYAGRISDHMGAFAQTTLDSTHEIVMDNSDIRYARTAMLESGPLIYGISLNNGPTVEDIYNTTPVWGYPFTSSEYANGPEFGTVLGSGSLAQTTAGAVAYTLYDNHWYGAVGVYHDTQASSSTASGLAERGLNGWSPYLRLAYQSESGHHNFHLGGYVMEGDITADVSAPSPTNTARFRDTGVDGQYQYINGVNTLTLRANYLNEKLEDVVNIGASKNELNIRNVTVNAEYFYDRTYGIGIGRFCVQGRADPAFYEADPLNPLNEGSPETERWLAEISYLPWEKAKISLQYIIYPEFNGGSSYISANTGTERNAGENNTLYLSAWFLF